MRKQTIHIGRGIVEISSPATGDVTVKNIVDGYSATMLMTYDQADIFADAIKVFVKAARAAA